MPPCSFNELKSYLTKSHFFIFPSSNFREGQSNSLTESLLYGVLPVANYQGFNESTIDDEMFMVKEIKTKAISDKLDDLIRLGQNKLNLISKDLQIKSKIKFSEKSVISVLKKVYDQRN